MSGWIPLVGWWVIDEWVGPPCSVTDDAWMGWSHLLVDDWLMSGLVLLPVWWLIDWIDGSVGYTCWLMIDWSVGGSDGYKWDPPMHSSFINPRGGARPLIHHSSTNKWGPPTPQSIINQLEGPTNSSINHQPTSGAHPLINHSPINKWESPIHSSINKFNNIHQPTRGAVTSVTSVTSITSVLIQLNMTGTSFNLIWPEQASTWYDRRKLS